MLVLGWAGGEENAQLQARGVQALGACPLTEFGLKSPLCGVL